jgi:hypothetical protein
VSRRAPEIDLGAVAHRAMWGYGVGGGAGGVPAAAARGAGRVNVPRELPDAARSSKTIATARSRSSARVLLP